MMRSQMDCDDVVQQIWDYLDGELPPARMRELEAHLEACAHCRGHAKFEQTFKTLLRRARAAAPDTTSLGERVRAALRAEGFQDPRSG